MPHLVGFVLIGAGLWAGYKAFVRISERVGAELYRAEEELRRRASQSGGVKNLGALEPDPDTGVYKPTLH